MRRNTILEKYKNDLELIRKKSEEYFFANTQRSQLTVLNNC